MPIEDEKKRFYELIKKANLEEEECEFLGDCYYLGKIVEKDLSKAIECYKKGCGYYNTWKIGECYFAMNTKEATAEGIKYFIKANSMSPNAALCYEVFLRYVSIDDLENAFCWLDNTFYNYADNFINYEEEEANLLLLAFMQLFGLGVNKDEKKAFALLNKYSIHDNSGRINYYLGLWSEFGFGTEKNIDKAKEYYRIAGDYEMSAQERLCFVQFNSFHGTELFYRLFMDLSINQFEKAMTYWKQLNGKENPYYEEIMRKDIEEEEEEQI